jgi:6-phosphogluconolactonase
MEIKQRMSKRFAWLLGLAGLIAVGFMVACGSTYNPSSDGLVILGSQGSALMETFRFSLASGSIAAVSNPPADTANSTCVLPGIPSFVALDPAGTYAYVILTANSVCANTKTGIAAFKLNSDGTISPVGSPVSDPNPVALAMDSKGKFLFVAEGLGATVSVYAIGSGASLTPVQATFNFTLPPGFQPPNFAALAPTPTILPGLGVGGTQSAVCSNPGNNPPTSEMLYVADSVNNVVWQFGVDTSTGALTNPPNRSSVQNFPAGAVPSGVAVDPCDRFVYVSNMQSNQISAYSICNGLPTQSQTACPTPLDWRLVQIAGSPFSLSSSANGPGPLVVDPFGNYLYVLDTLSDQVSPFHISPVSGSLTAGTVVATGNLPKSIAIRSDDAWLFVTDFNPPALSQYSIAPATGTLSPLPAITTDNYPWGVAVK